MSVTTFICDDYTTCLKIDKLHHPCNDNTRTMQKQLNNKFQAGTAKSAFFCACTHKMQIVVGKCKIAHSFLKNKIINLTDVGKDGSVTESHNS